MDPITGAIISGGLNILGGMAQNAAIKKAATEGYNANKLFIERDQSVAYESLLYQGQELNQQVGMALTDLGYEANRQFAAQEAKRAETNIYGNTAARQQAVAKMREALAADKVVQQGEASMMDINNRLRETKYQTEAKHAQNAQSYNNAMSQRKSSFELLVGGASGALSGYSTALNLNTAENALTIQKAQAANLGITLGG